METIEKILQTIEPISLNAMDEIQLMNRIDSKFAFAANRIDDLLSLVAQSGQYKILEINNERCFAYRSTYLDTCNYLFFNQHMSSRPGRYKVRYRTYENTGTSYLEVKCKTVKNRTIKWRIKNKLQEDGPDPKALNFLTGYIDDVALEIQPVLHNNFHRITLAGLQTKERITIDLNLSFSNNDGKIAELPFLAIAELKRDKSGATSPFIEILKKMQIRQAGFSKYCIGNALLREMPKMNVLKPKLLLLKKIENENTTRSVA